MFGLTALFWMACLLLVVMANRSARRHHKRAEMYRRQIEELQIERAIEKGKSFGFSYQRTMPALDTDKQKALIEVLARSIEVESKSVGVNHEGECVGRFLWNRKK